MLDSAQSLLLVVIVILAFLLVVLGVQTFFILREFRKTLVKTNKVLDEVKGGSNILKVMGMIAPVILGRNIGKNILSFLSKDENPEKPNQKLKVENTIAEFKKSSPAKTVRRFFRRSKG